MYFQNCSNTKQQGNVALGAAIAYFSKIGWTVSIPLNDAQEYDLVVEDLDGFLNKVQIKSTNALSQYNTYVVTLKNSGGTAGEIYARVCDSSCEYLFILTGNGTQYLLPYSVFKDNKSSMSLGSKYEEYIVS